jgi:hypothetical protein
MVLWLVRLDSTEESQLTKGMQALPEAVDHVRLAGLRNIWKNRRMREWKALSWREALRDGQQPVMITLD